MGERRRASCKSAGFRGLKGVCIYRKKERCTNSKREQERDGRGKRFRGGKIVGGTTIEKGLEASGKKLSGRSFGGKRELTRKVEIGGTRPLLEKKCGGTGTEGCSKKSCLRGLPKKKAAVVLMKKEREIAHSSKGGES